MIKQCFSWWCFVDRGVDHGQLLKRAVEIGYCGVELIQPDLFDLAIESGLEITTHVGHRSIEQGLNDLTQHDGIVQEIESFLPIAVKYKIPSLIVFSGSRQDGMDDRQGQENVFTGIQRVIRSAADAGVTLILELLNSKVDHPGYQSDRTSWGAAVCDSVGSNNMRLLYDIYHMQIMEGDLIRTIGAYHERIGHYHTAGNPGRGEIGANSQEISYPPVFRAIQSTGYDGYIGHEFIPAADPIKALQDAFTLTQLSLH